jgi:hypothetical protein
MRGFTSPARKGYHCFLMALCAGALNAQTCLMVSRPEIATGGTAFMNLFLYSSSGAAPAAIGWTFEYSSSDITSLTVDDGPSLTAAGKTSICNSDPAAYNCLAIGANANTVGNGVIARLTAVVAPGAPSPIVHIKNPLGASPEGHFIAIRVSTDCMLHPLRRRPVENEVNGQQEKK